MPAELPAREGESPRGEPVPDARRRRLICQLPAGLSLAGPLALAGCGGGGDGGSAVEPAGQGGAASTGTLQGVVSLPAGVRARDVSVVGRRAEAAVDAAGRFQLESDDDTPSLLSVVHADGRLLALAFVDPAQRAGLRIGAASTAQALVFLALGGWRQPAASRATLLELIAQDAASSAAMARLERRLATDASALAGGDGDAALGDALAEATAPLREAAHTAQRAAARESAQAEAFTPLIIEPANAVQGVAVQPDAAPVGVLLRNAKRRAGVAYVYKLGFEPAGGQRIDLDAPLRWGRIAVESAQPLGVYAAIGSGGRLSPAFSATQRLLPEPGATKTWFELVYLTPMYDRPEPALFADARYAEEVGTWRDELAGLFEAAQMELVFAALLEALGVGGAGYAEPKFLRARRNIKALNDTHFLRLLLEARNGTALLRDFQSWQRAVLLATADAADAQRFLLALTPVFEASAPSLSAAVAAGRVPQSRLTAFRGMLRLFSGLGLAASSLDLDAQFSDLQAGDKALAFGITLQQRVLLTPVTGKVARGRELKLAALVAGAQGGTLSYDWRLAGAGAVLSDNAGQTGLQFNSPKAAVTLITSPSSQGTISVAVDAFLVPAGGGAPRSLGTARGRIEVDPTVVTLSPRTARLPYAGGTQGLTASITPTPADLAELSYDGICASEAGSLSAENQTSTPRTRTLRTHSAQATYTADGRFRRP